MGNCKLNDIERSNILKDLCGRLPYDNTEVVLESRFYHDGKLLDDTKACHQMLNLSHIRFLKGEETYATGHWTSVKPILRPMESITNEEVSELFDIPKESLVRWEILFGDRFMVTYKIRSRGGEFSYTSTLLFSNFSSEQYEWLNRKGFDYRGLIKSGLAYEKKVV